MNDILYAGFAKTRVTPPMGMKIPGYFNIRISDGIITDLYLHATAFVFGEKKALLFSIDAIGMWQGAYFRIRDKLAERFGLDPDSIYITCTHSHTSFRIMNPVEDKVDIESVFYRRLDQMFCDVAKEAFESVAPVSDVKIARGTAEDVGFIRRYRMKDGSCKTNPGVGNPDIVKFEGEQDHSVQIVRILRENANEILLVNFGTHPDVIGGTKYCADWPGYTRDHLVGALENVDVMMLVGCQGDSNHINAFLPKGTKLKGVHTALKMARTIAGETLKLYDRAESVPFQKLHYAVKFVDVGHNPYDPADVPEALEIKEIYDRVKTSADPIFKNYKLNVPEALRIVRLENGQKTFRLCVSALQIGNIALVGFSGEPFTEIGLQVKKNSKLAMTLCTCITNGGQGYFPSAAAYAEKGYERSTSSFAPDVAQKLIDGGIDLIDQMELIEVKDESIQRGA